MTPAIKAVVRRQKRDAIRELCVAIGKRADLSLRSGAADTKRDVLMLEVDVGGLPYLAQMPLRATCEHPDASADLLRGRCAAWAVQRFLMACCAPKNRPY